MGMEFCVYCGDPKREKWGCCGENHFSEIYAFLCEDLNNKEYPYGVEWSYYKDGSDIIDVMWFKTKDECYDFVNDEGFTLPREEELKIELDEIDRRMKGASQEYDPPMTQTEEYLLKKQREEEYKSYEY